jgi:hypothetical protein
MVYVLWLGIGERSEDEEVLLPWEGMQEAYPSQGDAVQEGKGQLVRPRYLLSIIFFFRELLICCFLCHRCMHVRLT